MRFTICQKNQDRIKLQKKQTKINQCFNIFFQIALYCLIAGTIARIVYIIVDCVLCEQNKNGSADGSADGPVDESNDGIIRIVDYYYYAF